MDIKGTVTIVDSNGVAYTMENMPHDQFMKIKDLKKTFFVHADEHLFINPQHIVSVTWKSVK